MRPRLLDLFCGAGGASVGYHRAGFDVVGVDIAPQPNYPFEFHQADALEYLAAHGHEFDAIHASPPCQRYSTATADPSRHPDLIAPVRSALLRLRKPYAIENVPGAPLFDPARLCGSAFGLGVRRHRHFEANFDITERPCRHGEQGTPLGVYGQHPDREQHYRPNGQQRGIKARDLYEGQWAMGVDWMTWTELKESIPPAFTEWIGKHLISSLAIDASTPLGSSRAHTRGNDASPGRRTDSLPSMGGRSGSESSERLRQGASAENASCSLALSRGRDAQG